MRNQDFGFGLELEFLLADATNFQPLTHKDLDFAKLLALLDAIPTEDISSEGFNIKPLHHKLSPYLVEGYYLTDDAMKPLSLLPKGVEIRTPTFSTIENTLETLNLLYERLKKSLYKNGYVPVILSHHPTESQFEAAANYERHDYWQWALTATTTYGPDINISLPAVLAEKVDILTLQAKMNFYMPALTALSLASPLVDGGLWNIRGNIGKSIRTYRRSLWAPAFYIHEKPFKRFEFKSFEMSRSLNDYHAYFLLCLALLLDDKLEGLASEQSRIYDLGNIAIHGLESQITRQRAAAVLTSAERIAKKFGLQTTGLNALWQRLDSGRLPADDIIDIFQSKKSIPLTLKELVDFEANLVAPLAAPVFSLV